MPLPESLAKAVANPRRVVTTVLKHRLVQNAAVYAGSGVVRNAIPFLLMPVLTRYLSPADFGSVATFEVILAMAVVFVGLNLHGAIGVNFFRMERKELELYVANVVLISAITAVVMFGIAVVIFSQALFDLLARPTLWLTLIVVAAFAQALSSIALTLWQVEQRPGPYGLFQISQTAVNVALSLLFVIVLNWGWQGRLLAIIIASVLFGVLSLVVGYQRWYGSLTVRSDHIKDALAFGVPLVPHSLGNWVLAGVDRLFIASMLGVAAAGVYTVGYQIGMIVGLAATSFNQAWSPFLFEKLKEDDFRSKLKIVKFTYVYIPAIVAFALVVSLVAPWFLTTFVGAAFRDAHRYVLWVGLGYAANGMYLMVANYIFYAKKTHLLSMVTLIAAAVNIVLTYVLIRVNGAIGAAQATAASYFLSFVLTWALSARVYRMPWRVWNVEALENLESAAGTNRV